MLGFTVSFPKHRKLRRPSALTGSQRAHPSESWAPLLHNSGPGVDDTEKLEGLDAQFAYAMAESQVYVQHLAL